MAISGLVPECRSQVIQFRQPPQIIGGSLGSVTALRDVDGDGHGDFAIRSSGRIPSGPPSGCVILYSGATRQVLRILTGLPGRNEFVFGPVAELPDIDGDGLTDIVVGEHGHAFQTLGYAHAFSGASGALRHSVSSGIVSNGSNYGRAVAGIPDLDGDGVADFAVSAPFDSPPSSSGRVYVYSGATGELVRILASPQAVVGSNLGSILVGVPDMNGDGRGDVLARAAEPRSPEDPTIGVIYAFSGATGEAFLRIPYYGTFAPVPDLDGDNITDVLVGRGSFELSTGIVWVLSGASGELLYSLRAPSPPETRSSFGGSVAGTEDIDGDGRGDILVGAPTEPRKGFTIRPGAAYLFSGATGRLLRRFDTPSPDKGAHGSGGGFGAQVASLPDCNGDAMPELLAFAPGEIADGAAGRVYLFMSCSADWDFSGTLNSQDFFTFIQQFLTGPCDFNHDGVTNSQDFFDYLHAFFRGCEGA